MTLVQEITVWWTKKSRSALGAAARNAVPELFALPFVGAASDAVFAGSR